jgi:hypothetical protein
MPHRRRWPLLAVLAPAVTALFSATVSWAAGHGPASPAAASSPDEAGGPAVRSPAAREAATVEHAEEKVADLARHRALRLHLRRTDRTPPKADRLAAASAPTRPRAAAPRPSSPSPRPAGTSRPTPRTVQAPQPKPRPEVQPKPQPKPPPKPRPKPRPAPTQHPTPQPAPAPAPSGPPPVPTTGS